MVSGQNQLFRNFSIKKISFTRKEKTIIGAASIVAITGGIFYLGFFYASDKVSKKCASRLHHIQKYYKNAIDDKYQLKPSPTPSPSPTTGWEIYPSENQGYLTAAFSSEDGGYKLEYPHHWEIERKGSRLTIKTDNDTGMPVGPMPSTTLKSTVFISLIPNPENVSLKQAVYNKHLLEEDRVSIKFTEPKSFKYQALKTTEMPGMYGQLDYYFLKDDGLAYVNITLIPYYQYKPDHPQKLEPYPNQELIIPTFNRLLSSFRFLDDSTEKIPLIYEIRTQDRDNDERCKEKFNYDPANTTATYLSQKTGISLELPYNPNWGSQRFKVPPYDELLNPEWGSKRLEFGSVGRGEACSWVRSYTLNFLPTVSAEKAIQRIKDRSDYPDMFSIEPHVVTINNLRAVKYENYGLGVYPTLQVLGDKYNYEFVPQETGEKGDFTKFEQIIKTIKLID